MLTFDKAMSATSLESERPRLVTDSSVCPRERFQRFPQPGEFVQKGAVFCGDDI
jgi:hypothetical protein